MTALIELDRTTGEIAIGASPPVPGSRMAGGGPDELIDGLSGQNVAFAPGATLCGGGEPRRRIFVLTAGWAARTRRLSGGRRALLHLHLAGDVVGLDGLLRDGTSHDGVVALDAVGARALELAPLRPLVAQRPDLVLWLGAQRDREQRHIETLATLLGRCSAEERLAALLMSLHARLRRRRLADETSFRLPLTQQDIADHLGLTMVHVCRVLRRLRQERIVEVDRRIVTILDPHRLCRAAGEDGAAWAAPG